MEIMNLGLFYVKKVRNYETKQMRKDMKAVNRTNKQT